MLERVHIRNYKGIKDYSFEGFKRFNLLVGMNNAGKSSFLEALYLFASNFSLNSVATVLRSRGYLSGVRQLGGDQQEVFLEAITSLISGRSIEEFYRSGIEIEGDGHDVKCKMINRVENPIIKEEGIFDIQELGETNDVVEIGENPGLLVKLDGERAVSYSLNRLNSFRLRAEYGQRCQLVRTSQINREENPNLFDKITMTPYEKHLVPALQIINSRISAINFLKTDSLDRVPYVALDGVNTRCRLSSMGDGMNRLLTIVLALLNCENGFLLLDEFENGLHYSVQEKLWQVIMRLSVDLNVQVFATTHSNDCLRSFVSSDAYHDGLVVRLESLDNNVTGIPLRDKRLLFAINNGFDIR